jgi:hypothetical protein
MMHGHFDHVGALEDLTDEWDSPVYAHPLELSYLSGRASYPPGDPSVGGGLMAAVARLYPRGPVDVGARLQALPDDGTLSGMPGWRHIHIPRHSVGHVSFWWDADRTIVGDAFVTMAQDPLTLWLCSALRCTDYRCTTRWSGTKLQRPWRNSPSCSRKRSSPGTASRCEAWRCGNAHHRLARDFDRIAVPRNGRYLRTPARAEDGSAYCRPGS